MSIGEEGATLEGGMEGLGDNCIIPSLHEGRDIGRRFVNKGSETEARAAIADSNLERRLFMVENWVVRRANSSTTFSRVAPIDFQSVVTISQMMLRAGMRLLSILKS
ncbi:19349_t:CDS:2 [Rhizophagus irregularis]|nr:19349_t:CDS:2 [Rhizophagus irregularis]